MVVLGSDVMMRPRRVRADVPDPAKARAVRQSLERAGWLKVAPSAGRRQQEIARRLP